MVKSLLTANFKKLSYKLKIEICKNESTLFIFRHMSTREKKRRKSVWTWLTRNNRRICKLKTYVKYANISIKNEMWLNFWRFSFQCKIFVFFLAKFSRLYTSRGLVKLKTKFKEGLVNQTWHQSFDNFSSAVEKISYNLWLRNFHSFHSYWKPCNYLLYYNYWFRKGRSAKFD